MTNTHTQTKWEEWSKKWHLAPLTTILLIKIELKVQEITENKEKKKTGLWDVADQIRTYISHMSTTAQCVKHPKPNSF